MDDVRASLLAAYKRLDDEGKARIAAYIDALSARVSPQSAPNGMRAPSALPQMEGPASAEAIAKQPRQDGQDACPIPTKAE